MWPLDVEYFDGVRSRAGTFLFAIRVHRSLELFKSHGVGVRTRTFLPQGTVVGYYGCHVYKSHSEEDPSSRFVMSPDDGTEVVYDAKNIGNEMRFINDYRGISKTQNNVCMGDREIIYRWVTARPIVTIKDVQAGEELLLDYGESYWNALNMRLCTGCNRMLSLKTNYTPIGRGYRRECNDCRDDTSEEALMPIRMIGTAMELLTGDGDFVPVTVMSEGSGDTFTVGTYRCTWKDVPRSKLFIPRGPELSKTFASMEKVEILWEGAWCKAVVILALANDQYNVMWKGRLFKLSKWHVRGI